MFFGVIQGWGSERLAKLMLFINGSSQVPVNGFTMLSNMRRPVTIAPGGDRDRLPAAHTCTNTLDLPTYESPDELNAKLTFVIQECSTFGFI
jgi:hypothetical protein